MKNVGWCDCAQCRRRYFRECVRRLQDGEPAISVTRWLLTVPDRGDLHEVTKIHTMRRYLEVLRLRVLEAQKNAPPAAVTTKECKQLVEKERQRVDNDIAILGGPLKRETESASRPIAARPEDASGKRAQTMIEYLVARNAKNSERRNWLKATAEVNFERLQLARAVEEKINMPLSEKTKISQIMINAAEADTRAALAELPINKIKREEALANFDAINLDDKPVDKADAHTSDGEPKDAPQSASAATYRASPRLLEVIEVLASSSEELRAFAPLIYNFALAMMYGVDLIGEQEDNPKQTTEPTPSATNSPNRGIEKSQAAVGADSAGQVSPEDRWDTDNIAFGEDTLRFATARLDEFLPILIAASAADRAAVCSVFEIMLIMIESKDMFRIQPQTGNGAGATPPCFTVTPEDFDILKEYVATCQSLSPEARLILTRIQEIAFETIKQEFSRPSTCA
jgi:hypothetical protein